MKFRNTLLIVMLVFSLGPLYTISAWMIYENNTTTKELVKDNLNSISDMEILNIENFCESRNEAMGLLADYEIVQDAVRMSLTEDSWKENVVADYLDDLLQERKKTSVSVASVSVVNREFKNVASSEIYERGSDSVLYSAYKDYLTGKFAIGQVYNRVTDNGEEIRVVAAYKGIFDRKTEELLGYVVEEIPASYFDKYRAETGFGENVTVNITDANGELLSVSNSANFICGHEPTATESERAEYYRLWKSIDWDNTTRGSFEYVISGRKHITYYSKVPYTGWKMQITGDVDSYRVRTKTFIRHLSVGLIVLTAWLLFIVCYLSARLTSPLKKISDTLHKVREEKNYSIRVNSKGRDEFAMLSHDIDSLLEYAEAMDNKHRERNLQLSRQADRDSLTGLYNKEAIRKYIDWRLSGIREGEACAVGFVDIDNFRDYNTRYGHIGGDQILRLVSDSLKALFGEGIGRNGGDEFLFIVQVKSMEELIKQLDEFQERVQKGIVLQESGERIGVTCSIGVAIADSSEASATAMESAADKAMYQVKDNGKNGYVIL